MAPCQHMLGLLQNALANQTLWTVEIETLQYELRSVKHDKKPCRVFWI
jgi:hypothetical protein